MRENVTADIPHVGAAQVKALYGSKGGGRGGIRGTQIAVCTIEKANALINRMAVANVRGKVVLSDPRRFRGKGLSEGQNK